MKKNLKGIFAWLTALVVMLGLFPAVYAAEAEIIFSESFDGLETIKAGESYHGFSGINWGNAGDYYAEAESGLFGKSSDDKSMVFRVEERATTAGSVQTNPFVMFQNDDIKTGFQAGEQIRMSYQFAFDRVNDWSNLTYGFLIRAYTGGKETDGSNDGLCWAAEMKQKELTILNGSVKKTVNWAPHKWYRLELVFVPGDGAAVKNKLSAYLDGEVVAENLEFDADKTKLFSKLDGLGSMRFSRYLNATNLEIPGGASGSHQGRDFYVDEVSVTRYAAGDAAVSPVSVTANDAEITATYQSAFLLGRDMTVGEVKSKLNIAGGTMAFYGTDGTPLSDGDSANGSYLRVSNALGTSYDYYVARNITLYQENFNSYEPIANQPYKGFEGGNQFALATGVTSGGMSGLDGKAADDYSYVFRYENWRNGDTGESRMRWVRYNDDAISVKQTVTMEFSLLAIDGAPGARLAYVPVVGSGQFEALTLEGGKFKAAGKELADYEPNQWYEIAMEFSTNGGPVKIYINAAPYEVTFSSGVPATISAIESMKFAMNVNQGAADTTYNGGFAIDDFGVYAGTYDVTKAMGEPAQYGAARLFCDETDVSESSSLPASGAYQARIAVTKDGFAEESAYVILARYDNELLTAFQPKQVAFSRRDKQIASAAINAANVTENTRFRVFVWNSIDGLQPLCQSTKWGGV